jgi:serine/threonine protein kinase
VTLPASAAQGSNFIPYEDLQVQDPPQVLGRGGFGVVYLAKYKGTEVAVKEINGDTIEENEIESFLKEATLMKEMKPHPNVLQLIGITASPFCIITGN